MKKYTLPPILKIAMVSASINAPLTVPLCVDLDGTFIKSDTFHLMIGAYLRQRPWCVWQLFFWFMKGRAYVKYRLSLIIRLPIDKLIINKEFFNFLQREHERGRPIYLVTATADLVAQDVIAYYKIFTGYYASTPSHNLRAQAKAEWLTKTFREFIYAGNSAADIPVWQAASIRIAVNTPQRLRRNKDFIFDPMPKRIYVPWYLLCLLALHVLHPLLFFLYLWDISSLYVYWLSHIEDENPFTTGSLPPEYTTILPFIACLMTLFVTPLSIAYGLCAMLFAPRTPMRAIVLCIFKIFWLYAIII